MALKYLRYQGEFLGSTSNDVFNNNNDDNDDDDEDEDDDDDDDNNFVWDVLPGTLRLDTRESS